MVEQLHRLQEPTSWSIFWTGLQVDLFGGYSDEEPVEETDLGKIPPMKRPKGLDEVLLAQGWVETENGSWVPNPDNPQRQVLHYPDVTRADVK